jgi:hypothetical protein
MNKLAGCLCCLFWLVGYAVWQDMMAKISGWLCWLCCLAEFAGYAAWLFKQAMLPGYVFCCSGWLGILTMHLVNYVGCAGWLAG